MSTKVEKSLRVFFPNSQEEASPKLIGGKGNNLYLLGTIKEIRVPKWFIISTKVFQEFLNENGISEDIKALNDLKNEDQIIEKCQQIQKKILSSPLKNEDLEALDEAYKLLKEGSVAVRSSGVLEDLSYSSFAGLYDTLLNQKGFNIVCFAVKKIWASTFNERVVFERSRLQVSQENCLLAVIIQEMVPAKVSGVTSSLELSTNYPGIEISANYGTGESVVGGEVSVDKWLVHTTNNYIIKSVLGNKGLCHVFDVTGTKELKVDIQDQKKFSLQNVVVSRIANQTKTIRARYDSEIDTEFAIDSEGTLFFVQSRPIVKKQMGKAFVVDPSDLPNHQVIARGHYSVPGIVSGVLKFVESWEDLAKKKVKIDPDDIVLAYISSSTWSHYLTQFGGLITKQGGPTAHPILLCRERGVPSIVGIEDDFEALRKFAGQVVTLDGINRTIYSGKVKLKEASIEDLSKPFETVAVKEWPSAKKREIELQKSGALIFSEGENWLKSPLHPLKRLFQEINLNRFNRIPILINRSFPIKARVLDHFVCSDLAPYGECVERLKGMSIEECETFFRGQDENIKQYTLATQTFQLNLKSWQNFLDAVTDLRAYVWIGGIVRSHAERQLEIMASKLNVPQYYIEECTAAMQSQLEEEDSLMQESIYHLATKMAPLSLPSSVNNLGSELFSEVEKLGYTYRFDKDMSIEKPLDLNLVYERLLLEVNEIKKGKTLTTMKKTVRNEEFFPEHPLLKRWLYLSIFNRVIQSNSHHVMIRGQWNVRTKLLELGQQLVSTSLLKTPEDIFDLSIEAITSHLMTL